MERLKKWQTENNISDLNGNPLIKEDGTHDRFARFNMNSLSKGAEQELWEAVAYEVPALGHEPILINQIPYKVAMPQNDKVTIPTLTAGTPAIYREGSTPSYSASGFSPGAVEVNTKDQVGVPWSITRKQKESMSFDLMAGILAVQNKAVIRYIQKDIMRRMALELATGNRLEFASGDAWTVALLYTMKQKIVENGGNPGNIVLAIDPEYLSKLYALEDTEGRNLFLDASIYGAGQPLYDGVIGKVLGMDVIIVNDLPGVEDDWSAIETTETHKCMFAFDRSAVVMGLEAQPYVFELASIATGAWEMLLQRFYGSKVLNANLVVGLKEYEA